MKGKLITIMMLTLFLTTMSLVAPAAAMGPKKAKGNKVIYVDDPKSDHDYYIIVSKRGWRQWRTDIDRFAIVLFTEGMTEEAIESHLDEGWNGPWTMLESDPRYEYVSPYVEDPVEIIWRYHDIPAGD